MQDNERLEEISMLIIANSGAARGSSFEALAAAKRGEYEKAQELMKTADEQFHAAHEAHRGLLAMDANGEIESLSVLITHAQDHLMTSVLAQEMIREIITLHRKLDDKNEEVEG